MEWTDLILTAKKKFSLKGQFDEIFASGFFHETFPPAPEYSIKTVSNFLRKFTEIFASQGAPPVSTTPAANLPPVSTTAVVNFSTIFVSVVDTCGNLPPVSTIPAANLPSVSTMPVANCHRYLRHRRQICHRCKRHRLQTTGTNIKVNLKIFLIYMLTLLPKGVQKKSEKIC